MTLICALLFGVEHARRGSLGLSRDAAERHATASSADGTGDRGPGYGNASRFIPMDVGNFA